MERVIKDGKVIPLTQENDGKSHISKVGDAAETKEVNIIKKLTDELEIFSP
jgi:hypothetical protein